MKLGYITVMVRDLERSLTFYQELAQLQVMRRFRPGPGEIAFLVNGAGETMLELVAIPDAEHVCTRGLVVSFAAEGSLEGLRQKAAELGYEASEIVDHPPKPRHFIVSDPDGLTVEFSA